MDVSHLLIHSTVSGHLGSSHLGAIMNNTDMNKFLCGQALFPLYIDLGVEFVTEAFKRIF